MITQQKSPFKDRVFKLKEEAERVRFEEQFNEPDKYRFKVIPVQGGYKISITAQPGTLHPNQSQPVPIGYLQEIIK